MWTIMGREDVNKIGDLLNLMAANSSFVSFGASCVDFDGEGQARSPSAETA
jgi:hypothetical protein